MKTKEKLTPEAQIKINTINLFADNLGYDVYMTVKHLTQSIDCKVTRFRKKKQYIELYEKYIKGTKKDIGTNNTTSKRVKTQLPKNKHINFRLTTKKKLEIMNHCLKNNLSYSDYIMSLVDKDLRK